MGCRALAWIDVSRLPYCCRVATSTSLTLETGPRIPWWPSLIRWFPQQDSHTSSTGSSNQHLAHLAAMLQVCLG